VTEDPKPKAGDKAEEKESPPPLVVVNTGDGDDKPKTPFWQKLVLVALVGALPALVAVTAAWAQGRFQAAEDQSEEVQEEVRDLAAVTSSLVIALDRARADEEDRRRAGARTSEKRSIELGEMRDVISRLERLLLLSLVKQVVESRVESVIAEEVARLPEPLHDVSTLTEIEEQEQEQEQAREVGEAVRTRLRGELASLTGFPQEQLQERVYLDKIVGEVLDDSGVEEMIQEQVQGQRPR